MTLTSLYRPAARAFLVAVIVAVIADALLAAVTGLARVAGAPEGPPWWVAAHLVERGRWVVLALLFATAAKWLAPPPGTHGQDDGAATIWRAVAGAVMVVPLAWILATWATQAALFTAADRWSIDGAIFLAPGYYRQLFTGYVPWFLGGAATMVASRHVA